MLLAVTQHITLLDKRIVHTCPASKPTASPGSTIDLKYFININGRNVPLDILLLKWKQTVKP